MVTQAPRKSAIFAAVAFALSCIGLMIFVWTQFGGTVPFAPQGYRVHALFPETGLLVPNADVRIAGVNVGKVSSVQARGVNSYVTLDLSHEYAPIPADTRAILRQKTLLGEAYVELSTGSGSGAKLPDGGTITRGHIQPTEQLDRVLGSFNKPAQRNLQALLNGTYTSLAGRGQELNDAIGNLDPTFTELAALTGILNQQSSDVRGVISNSATVLGALSQRSADLQSLITAGDQVLSSTAARSASLRATVNALPPFLGQLRATLGTLDTTLTVAKPSLDALRPAAPLLRPVLADLIALSGPAIRLLHDAPRLLRDASLALPSITRFSRAFRPAVDAILPAARELAPVISFIGVYHQELVAAMANLAASLQASAAANTDSGTANYLRAVLEINNESFYGQSVREPTNRNNAYFSPGELNNIVRGALEVASCANTRNASQVAVLANNVRCVPQPPYAFGHGLGRVYYPHLTRTPLPSK